MKTKTVIIISMLAALLTAVSCNNQNRTPNHVHDYSQPKVLQEASCIVRGITEHYCSCGAMITTVEEKTDHRWDGGTLKSESTAEKHGIMEYRCTVCRKVKSEELPLHVHDFYWTKATRSHFTEVTEYHECACGYRDDERTLPILPFEGTRWRGKTTDAGENQGSVAYYIIDFRSGGKALFDCGVYFEETGRTALVPTEATYEVDTNARSLTLKVYITPNNPISFSFMMKDEKENMIEFTQGNNGPGVTFIPYDHVHQWDTGKLIPIGEMVHGHPSSCCPEEKLCIVKDEASAAHVFEYDGQVHGACRECGYMQEFMIHFTFEPETMEYLKNSVITVGDRTIRPGDHPEGQCCNSTTGLNYGTKENSMNEHLGIFRATADENGWVVPEIRYTLEDGRTGTFVFRDANNDPDAGAGEEYHAGDRFYLSRFSLGRRDENGSYVYWNGGNPNPGSAHMYGFRFTLSTE